MKPRVYVETTIPSFFYTGHRSADAIARRDWTRQWWDHESAAFELVTSLAVHVELNLGIRHAKNRIALIATLPILAITDEIYETAQMSIEQKAMPADINGDALHVAIASHYECQYLLTWNCRHLANHNKLRQLEHLNQLLGLKCPIITTPLSLFTVSDENKTLPT
jgi:predicted nucleic acid-binding protein